MTREPTEHALQRGYRRLLLAYPAEYRRARADEILGTLLDAAAPGQRRPTIREATALGLGGLRVRVGAHRPRTVGEVWREGCRFAVLFLLAHAIAATGAHTGRVLSDLAARGRLWALSDLGHPLAAALALAALLLVAYGRYTWAPPVIGVATAVWLWPLNSTGLPGRTPFSLAYWVPYDPQFWLLPLAAVLALALLRRRAPVGRRPWTWLAAVPAAVLLLPNPFDATLDNQPWAFLATIGACLLWTVVDARVGLAAAALLLAYALFVAGVLALWGPQGDFPVFLAVAVLVLTVLLSVTTVRSRRQARL
jgi:hypothetical protein